MRFEDAYKFDKRRKDALKVLSRYPDRIPIIVQIGDSKSKKRMRLDKHKFLVPNDMKFGQFAAVLRQRMRLKPEVALFTMCKKNGRIPATSDLMISIYHTCMGRDHFLYLDLFTENTFGTSKGRRPTWRAPP